MPTLSYDPGDRFPFKGWLLNLTRWRVKSTKMRGADRARRAVPARAVTDTATVERIIDPASEDLEQLVGA